MSAMTMSEMPAAAAGPTDRAVESVLPTSGRLQQVSPLVRRRICGNGGPFTATGTCSYIVGRGEVAVVDPGPDDDAHVRELLRATEGETIAAIVVTHTHRDHSPGARLLKALTGAPIVGCGPHRPARVLAPGDVNHLDASADRDHRPDRELADGEAIAGKDWTLTAVATPGHTMNHLAFALAEETSLFSGDHVMAWSTTIVAPPDGSMRAYMESLDRLRTGSATLYWPGHGGPVRDPQRFLRSLAGHRRQREAAIRERLTAGDRTIRAVVSAVYQGLDPVLQNAAALSVLAHLEDLVERGLVRSDGPPRLEGAFEPS